MLSEFLGRQLRKPRGIFGRHVMTRLLNQGNRDLLDCSVEALELSGATRLLDVGFGGGYALRRVAALQPALDLYGIDLSPEAVLHAHRYCRQLVLRGRLKVCVGEIEHLPFRDAWFSHVITTNTLYFWQHPERAASELRRVLVPAGQLVIGFSGSKKLHEYPAITRHGFTSYEPDQVTALLTNAGFHTVTATALERGNTRGDHLVVAHAPAAAH